MVLVNRQQRTEATGHIAHHRRFATHDVHGLRGKARSIEQYGDITQVPDGWDQPNPTRLVPQGGGSENKHQDLFAGPVCLRCGAVILAACFRKGQQLDIK